VGLTGWAQAGTLIVDDKIQNALENLGSAITVTAWRLSEEDAPTADDTSLKDKLAWKDDELAQLMVYLSSEAVAGCRELHRLDKRLWRSAIAVPAEIIY
jgi:hypothetical protein